eukprot:2742050-Lingulodinium_polyedra.AAC.1
MHGQSERADAISGHAALGRGRASTKRARARRAVPGRVARAAVGIISRGKRARSCLAFGLARGHGQR